MWVSPEHGRGTRRRLAAFAWGLLVAKSAWAGPSDIAVRIRCPVLSEVSAAEFEARAKVDLSARAKVGGELEVFCDDLAARIRWRQRAGAWFARSMPPTGTPATLVDALLVASKDLVEEAARFEKAPDGDAAKERAALDSGVPIDAGPSNASDGEQVPPRVVERSPQERPPSDVARSGGAEPSSDRSTADAASQKWALGVSAGTQAALFSTRGTGIVGPSVGIFLSLPGGLVGTLAGEYDFALGAGDMVRVRMASAAAVLSAGFGRARAFELGIGAWAGSVLVGVEPPYRPTSLSQGLWGALVRGRYALRRDAWRVAIGPELRWHGFRPEIAVDHATVWAVPAVSLGLALDVSWDFYGSQ